MPFRRKTRNPVSRPEKENEGMGIEQPLSPRLIRCKSDSTNRTCSEISLNKSSSTNGALSAEVKISNLMQLNGDLVKQITSLRRIHSDTREEFAELESSLRAENSKLTVDLSSLLKETSVLKEEKENLLASQEDLQFSLATSREQIDDLSKELEMVKAERKQAMDASEEQLASATSNLIELKENAALIISEKGALFEEKEIALRGKTETEDKLAAVCKRERELAKLLQVETKASADAQETLTMLKKEVEKLYTQKEDLIVKGAAHENEMNQRLQSLEESLNAYTIRVNSLTLQIEGERANHTKAMKSGEEETDRKLSEASVEVMAAKQHLQESQNQVEILSMQIQKDRINDQAETKTLMEKLNESMQKMKAMEELLEASNVSVEVFKNQIKENSAIHQDEVECLQENVSAMAVQMRSLSTENQRLMSKKENLHKELSRVNQKQRESNEKLDSERKAVSEGQKSVQMLEQKCTQFQVEREKSLKEVDLLKLELSDCHKVKETLLSDQTTLLSEKVKLEADILSLRADVLKLLNERQDEKRTYAEEKQKLLTKLKKVESSISDLEVEQSDILKQLNIEKMAVAAAQEMIVTLESSKEALTREVFNMKATFTEQLCGREREVSSLQDEVQRLCHLNTQLHEQVTCKQLEKEDVMVEKQRVIAEFKRLEVGTLELSSAKEALEQKLEDEKAKALGAMLSLRHELDCLQQLKEQLTKESMSARSNAEAVAMDSRKLSRVLASVQGEKVQLESCLSELSTEFLQVRERVELASIAKAKQNTDMEQLQNEIAMLTSVNSELMSSIKIHEDQCKLLMSENEKKDEQIAFLSRLSADLEVSYSALEGKMAKQKAACAALESDNAVLQSSIETKAKALLALERQVDDSAKRTAALESQTEAMSSKHYIVELQLKALQEELMTQNAALDAEKYENSMLGSQLETNKERRIELESTLSAVKEELANASIAATRWQDQAKANLNRLMCEKDNEIGKLKVQVDEASEKTLNMAAMLKTCNDKKDKLEAQLTKTKAELATAKGQLLKAEKQLNAAEKLEGELKAASKRVSLLEARLTTKATMQNELEFQVKSLQKDLQAARVASAKAESDWTANMEAMRETADVRSRALEEQLESVKKTLDEMQNSANRGQQSIASLQMHPRVLETEDPVREEEKVKEDMQAKMRLVEKAKFVKLALPVFLISAASSLVIAYMKTLEN